MDIACRHIHHVSLLVDDMDAAVGFYRDVLHLEEVPRPGTFEGNPRYQVRWFRLGDQQIHLIPSDADDGHQRRHFCIAIGNEATARRRCQELGLEIQDEVEIPGIRRFFIFDPCGNRIELAEWVEAGQTDG